MRKQAFAGRGSLLSRVAVVSLVGGLAAACSSNTARFSDDPFSNPFNGSSGSANVASSPAPQYQQQSQGYHSAPPAQSAANYAPSAAPSSYQPVASVGNGGGWTAHGGTQITVGQGDSLTSISNRYGVPANAILSANNLKSASQVSAGSNIIVPIYSVGPAPVMTASAPVAAPTISTPVASASAHALPPARSNSLGQLNQRATEVVNVPVKAVNNTRQVADAKVSAARTVAQNNLSQPVAATKFQAEKAQQKAVEPVRQVAEAPKTVARDTEQTASLANASQSNAEFRWPAKGRVIGGFGSSGGNEGINIAVPEGTPVRATESGTVTFAGDDVKSYGNLVLIKHDNGYISAYAHNGSLDVRRGDRVKRGQVIAKSGQTGDVTSPQLHFEIRKGQTPVDPIPYLGS